MGLEVRTKKKKKKKKNIVDRKLKDRLILENSRDRSK